MEYITSGDRIAVENFEIGSLYKVTFLNETEVYFMCCGIGKDFVMLMSNEPRLFSLTMLSAAEVDAIDEYTPLPPPTPPTNLLQYQTGEPPFTFTTTDTELFSWYIKGPAGDKTANLLNPNGTWSPPSGQTADVTVSGNSITITDKYYAYTSVPVTANGNYTAKYSATGDRVYVVAYRAQPFTTANMITSLATTGTTINVGNTDTVWLLFYSGDGTTGTTTYSNFMFNEGSVPLDFEPYGYKIPILCNTTLSNIYINEALGENDILYSTDTTYTIATELGDNLLQVQGETQPSLMQIVYKWEFEG